MNTEIVNEIRNALKTQINDRIPNPIPVIEVSPKKTKNLMAKTSGATTTGAITFSVANLFATGKDVYVCGYDISIVKNAACDVATGTLSVGATPYDVGTSSSIGGVVVLTLTAERIDKTVMFDRPLRLVRDTGVSLSGTFTAGAMARNITLFYYLDDSGNA